MPRTAQQAAVFLDRDGTLIEERAYLHLPEEVRLLGGAAAAVIRLRQAGFAIVLVTNQSGVGRGLFPESDVHAVHEELVRQLAEAGAQLDGLYYCPLAPVSADKATIDHPDRKPGPGMLVRAARDLDLDLARSWMIGDSLSDVLAGRNAGCRGSLLVRTGHPLTEEWADDWPTFADLAAAADHILRQSVT